MYQQYNMTKLITQSYKTLLYKIQYFSRTAFSSPLFFKRLIYFFTANLMLKKIWTKRDKIFRIFIR